MGEKISKEGQKDPIKGAHPIKGALAFFPLFLSLMMLKKSRALPKPFYKIRKSQ